MPHQYMCAVCQTVSIHPSCPVCTATPVVPVEPPLSTQDRLSIEWEKSKHLLPDGELKQFLSRAVMLAMEKWVGGEPPRQRPLTVVIMTQDNCDHEFKGRTCQKCGLILYIEDDWTAKITPYSGGSLGW